MCLGNRKSSNCPWSATFTASSMRIPLILPKPLCKICIEKLLSLLFGVIHSLTVLLRAPIASQSETVNLVFIDSQLMRDIRLRRHNILNFSHRVGVQKTIFVSYSQAERPTDRVEVTRDSNKSWMAGICSVNLAMSRKNSVSPSPKRQKPGVSMKRCLVSRLLPGHV